MTTTVSISQPYRVLVYSGTDNRITAPLTKRRLFQPVFKSFKSRCPKDIHQFVFKHIRDLNDEEIHFHSQSAIGSTLPGSQSRLIQQQHKSTEKFQSYVGRSLLNTLGPVGVTGFYLFIVLEYLSRPSVNAINSSRLIDGKGVCILYLLHFQRLRVGVGQVWACRG